MKGNRKHLFTKLNRIVSSISELQSSQDYQDFLNDVASGRFYELCRERIGAVHPEILEYDRGQMKVEMFFILFSMNQQRSKFKTLFEKIYPNVAKTLTLIKSGKGQHNLMAILLQIVESYLILQICVPKIYEMHPDAYLLTLHDSIAGHKEYINDIQQIMQGEATKLIGFAPELRIDRWEVPDEE